MTPEEVLAMEPGPEMDALVAEHVMGIEMITIRTYLDPNSRFPQLEKDGGPKARRVVKTDGIPDLPEPYSTSDAAALEVLKAAATGEILISREIWNAGEVRWFCSWTGSDRPHAATLALAICRAALLSKH